MDMDRFSKFTVDMQAMLPQWMKMAQDPTSNGAQFLNVFGLEFEDVEEYLEKMVQNLFLGAADVGQIDIIYKAQVLNASILEGSSLTISAMKEGSAHPFRVVDTVREFYLAPATENVAILDVDLNQVYLRIHREWMNANLEAPIQHLLINNLPHFEYAIHHVWNSFDELALTLGLYRLRGEENASFKERILDVFRSPANSTKSGLINGLAREFGIDKTEVSIHELGDAAFRRTLINEDGTPSQKLLRIAKQTNDLLGATWGNMTWDEAYWHSIEESHTGLDYLPHVWDASMDDWKDEDFQSGIGDGNDLKVRAPEELSDTRTFKYFVGLRGKERGTELVNPEMSFKYKILAKGKVDNESYKPEGFRYTIVSSEIIKLYYIVRAYKTYTYETLVDFGGTMPLTYDNPADANLEVVTGQTVMSKNSNQFLQIEAELRTSSKVLTPKLNSLDVIWEDTAGASNTLSFTTQADFDKFNTVIKTEKLDIITTVGGDVELGYGDFYYMMDSKEDFLKGRNFENITVGNQGTIRLTPFVE